MKTAATAAAIACTAGKPRSPGRVMLVACLHCVQAISPDWPLLVLWPCIKISLLNSMVRWSRPMPARRKIRRRAAAKVRRMLNKSRAARFLSLDV
jgi:hypothetical protein